VLPINWTVVRLFLHVLAAAIWVGGQFVLAGLVPGLRRVAPEAPRQVARSFNRLAWPAFAVLVLTGIWNVTAVHRTDTKFAVTLGIKLVVVLVSGVSAALHAISRSKRGLAIWGAVSGLSALAALFFGIVLAG
jgi:putative copper export protein